MRTEGDFRFWRNALPEDEYTGYGTSFEEDRWKPVFAPSSLQVVQRRSQWLGAGFTIQDEEVLRFDGLQFGFGWRAVHMIAEEPQPIDLEALGLAPADERYEGVDFSSCQLDQARVIVALSQYDGTEAELVERATEGDRGAPETWYEVVRHRGTYKYLFEDAGTEHLGDATFAFLTVEMRPRCGGWRFAFVSEEQLAGPVTRRQ